MRLSTAKDKVLYALIKKEPIDKLKIDQYLIYTALVELSEQGFLEKIETSVMGSGRIATYTEGRIFPKSQYFVDSKQSFRRKEIMQSWIDAPKNLWMIGAVISLISTHAYLIIETFSKKEPVKKQIELQVKHGIKSDTITVYQK